MVEELHIYNRRVMSARRIEIPAKRSRGMFHPRAFVLVIAYCCECVLGGNKGWVRQRDCFVFVEACSTSIRRNNGSSLVGWVGCSG